MCSNYLLLVEKLEGAACSLDVSSCKKMLRQKLQHFFRS